MQWSRLAYLHEWNRVLGKKRFLGGVWNDEPVVATEAEGPLRMTASTRDGGERSE